MSKKNPRSRPASWSDIEKAAKKSRDETIKIMLYLMCFVLKERMGRSDKWISKFCREFRYQYEAIAEGRVSSADIELMLKTGYNINVNFRGEEI